jgi:linoleoyl-CoA desaturase
MSKYQNLKFSNQQQDFFVTLNQRVNAYFKSNKIERTANSEMVIKTIVMFLIYLIPFSIILSGAVQNTWALLGLCVIMGIGIAGIGLSVMHDANHGAYSSKPWVNNLLGLSLNFVGGHAMNWKVQHNVLHHTYTNIHDADEDISPRGILRMAPESKWLPIHKFQHYYAWFFYGLMTLVWVLSKDFVRLIKYSREGLIKKQRSTPAREWATMLISKAVYFLYLFGLPMWLLPVTFGEVLIGFLVMHYVAGFILAIIFQPAHVVEGTEYPEPDAHGNLENSWAIHQLHTTTNFGQKQKLFSWYVGGLNYQVEHHLFPNICHVHYRNIAPIVEQTAKEFNLPYKNKETFIDAVVAHAVQLKLLSKRPEPTIGNLAGAI